MANTPTSLVSIITRTKDRHVLLERALRSVLDQKHGDWEHIIVNDGGDSEALNKFLQPYEKEYKERLKVIHNPESLGMQGATNRGLDEATGIYLAIHDDDDAWHPDFLQECVAFLEKQPKDSPYRGVITQTVRIWEEVDKKGRIVELSRDDYMLLDHVNLFRAGFENPFPPIAFLYRRAVHEEIGRFNPVFDVAGDLDFNVRFMSRYEIGVVPRKLAYYHWRRKSRDEKLENSVVAEKKLHGRKLNEWLNYCLREGGPVEEELGLALNLARYSVELQSSAAETFVKLRDLKEHLGSLTRQSETLTALLNNLTQLNENGLTAQLDRFGDLKEHMGSLTGIAESLLSTQHGYFQDLKEHLGSLSNQNDNLRAHMGGLIQQGENVLRVQANQFQDLKDHLTSLSGLGEAQLSENQSRLEDIKSHLNSQTQIIQGEVLGQIKAADENRGQQAEVLKDLKAHLHSQTNLLENGVLRRVDAVFEAGEQANHGQTERLVDLKAHLNSLVNLLNNEIVSRLENVERLTRERSRELKIGPLRLRWVKSGRSKEQ